MYDIVKYGLIIIAFLYAIYMVIAPADKMIPAEKVPDEKERAKQVKKNRILGIIIIVCVILMFFCIVQ